MLIIIISRSNLKLDHVGSKTRLLGHQATQVSDLGPLWPSCFSYSLYVKWCFHVRCSFKQVLLIQAIFYVTVMINLMIIITYHICLARRPEVSLFKINTCLSLV